MLPCYETLQSLGLAIQRLHSSLEYTWQIPGIKLVHNVTLPCNRVPEECSQEIADLLASCLLQDYEARPSATDIIQASSFPMYCNMV